MSERQAQQGDGEVATCHVCGQTFDSQLELSEHLKDMHPEDVLPNPDPADAQASER
jgi:hypothetical protein